LTGGLHLLALPLLIFAFLAHLAFAASLGLWFSVVSPSKTQATLRAKLTLFGVVVGSMLLGETVASTTPVIGLWVLAFRSWNDPHVKVGQVLLALGGAVAYAMAAFVLWRLACERFGNE